MGAYVLRRLLLMVPTFFGISLIVFVVLNLAPGRPGSQKQSDIATDLNSQATQESYRIFREQFALDKPTLFNARFALEEHEVEQRLRAVLEVSGATAAERIAAQEELEDWGQHAIVHLMAILERTHASSESALRDVTLRFLQICARRPLIDPFSDSPSPELQRVNREIDAENALIRGWNLPPGADEQRIGQLVDNWRSWYSERRERYTFTTGEKIRTLLFDTRFATYWRNLLRLDFGVSLVSREPVVQVLLGKLKYSLSMSVGSLLLAYLIAIPLGIFSAVKKDSRADRSVTLLLFMLYSLPSFFVATVLLFFFSQGSDWASLRWFPTGGWASEGAHELTWLGRLGDVLWHLVLPLFCLTYGSLAALSRYMRTGLLEVIRSDYVRTARAKGLPESLVVGKHALRNGLMPILTLLAGLLPAVLGGSVIIEYIFGIPGMGLWLIDSIYQRDYNVIMAVQLLSTILVLWGLLLTDLSYALVDPRIRYS